MPCGFGRHSRLLSKFACEVISADKDKDVFSNSWHSTAPRITPVVLNAEKDLPFKESAFSAIVVVHYYTPGLIAKLSGYLCPNGLLVIESFGGHGNNWEGLPKAGQVAEDLGSGFEVILLKERIVGPKNNVSFKLVARKKIAFTAKIDVETKGISL